VDLSWPEEVEEQQEEDSEDWEKDRETFSRSGSLPFEVRGAAGVFKVEVNVPAARSRLSAESERFTGGFDEVERQIILNF
jgi:hypothetical protein